MSDDTVCSDGALDNWSKPGPGSLEPGPGLEEGPGRPLAQLHCRDRRIRINAIWVGIEKSHEFVFGLGSFPKTGWVSFIIRIIILYIGWALIAIIESMHLVFSSIP